MEDNNSHFQGKTAPEHLKEARKRGQAASEPLHGSEPCGSFIAATDAAKESSLFLATISLLFSLTALPSSKALLILGCFSVMLLIWKTARSALLGWSRLERVHRLIKQEKWEIDHHRAEEKAELLEIYKAKGFKNKQLEEVVEVLMADDNRLLQVMLEEELGLPMGRFEHPLKQALGAFLATFVSCFILLILFAFSNHLFVCMGAFFIHIIASVCSAKHLNNAKTPHLIWSLGSFIVSLGSAYFIINWLLMQMGS